MKTYLLNQVVFTIHWTGTCSSLRSTTSRLDSWDLGLGTEVLRIMGVRSAANILSSASRARMWRRTMRQAWMVAPVYARVPYQTLDITCIMPLLQISEDGNIPVPAVQSIMTSPGAERASTTICMKALAFSHGPLQGLSPFMVTSSLPQKFWRMSSFPTLMPTTSWEGTLWNWKGGAFSLTTSEMENRIVCKIVNIWVPRKGCFGNVDNPQGMENYRQTWVWWRGEMLGIHAKPRLSNFEYILSIAAEQLTPVRGARWIHQQQCTTIM